jgi:hypothetical protein
MVQEFQVIVDTDQDSKEWIHELAECLGWLVDGLNELGQI